MSSVTIYPITIILHSINYNLLEMKAMTAIPTLIWSSSLSLSLGCVFSWITFLSLLKVDNLNKMKSSAILFFCQVVGFILHQEDSRIKSESDKQKPYHDQPGSFKYCQYQWHGRTVDEWEHYDKFWTNLEKRVDFFGRYPWVLNNSIKLKLH